MRENPQGLYMLLLICISRILAKHGRPPKKKIGKRKLPKSASFNPKGLGGIMHFGRFAILFEKKVWDCPGDFFTFC